MGKRQKTWRLIREIRAPVTKRAEPELRNTQLPLSFHLLYYSYISTSEEQAEPEPTMSRAAYQGAGIQGQGRGNVYSAPLNDPTGSYGGLVPRAVVGMP